MASLKYFLIRTVLFVVPFAVFMALGIGVLLSAVFAVVIAFAVNFLFLTRQRNAAAGEVRDVFAGRKQVRSKHELADAEVEDAIDDAQRAEGDRHEAEQDRHEARGEDRGGGSRSPEDRNGPSARGEGSAS